METREAADCLAVNISRTRREANKSAHSLARQAHAIREYVVWLGPGVYFWLIVFVNLYSALDR